ncbi:unnamed protein product [Linum trigynum]|uniref:Uncharacterized protein n=1 Tax=Linum trigynum TaxID=586398 RepID=A0AAV2CGI1_9ROSI
MRNNDSRLSEIRGSQFRERHGEEDDCVGATMQIAGKPVVGRPPENHLLSLRLPSQNPLMRQSSSSCPI